LVDSFEIELKSLRRSPQTQKIYLSSVRRYLQWCADNQLPVQIDRRQVQQWIADILESGAQASTAQARLAGVRQFSKWLAAEGEIDADPLLKLNAPKGDIPITPVLTDEQLDALIKVCQGKSLRDRRDEAIVRLLAETGMRAGELMDLGVDDVDVVRGLATIRRGKGGKGRVAAFGPQTAKALDRYIRLRRTHPGAESKALWLGARTHQPLGPHGLRTTLADRARRAGVPKFHPHVLRHTLASNWLSQGGSEGGLMAIAGWSSREMLDRYARATATQRAIEEARTLKLGER
jgi:site-specific recombinase XerD